MTENMLVLEIEYLNGVSFAAKPSARSEPEWPPHPDRAFLSLVAAWGQSDRDANEADALRWLESQPPPDILFPDAGNRDQHQSFVPVSSNSEREYLRGVFLKPLSGVSRKPRTFPASVLPDDENTVHMVWPGKSTPKTRDSLQRLAGRVSHVGHSASLVRMTVTDSHPVHARRMVVSSSNDGPGGKFLRCPYGGRFDELVDGFDHASQSAGGQWRPSPAPTRTYGDPLLPKIANVLGGTWTVLACRGNAIPPLQAFPAIAKRLRDAIMSHIPDPVHGIISGHDPDGKPIRAPHMAIVPLANVGWGRYSDASLKGVAMVLPAGAGYGTAARRQLLGAVSRLLGSGNGETGCLNLGRDVRLNLTRGDDRRSLEPGRYVGRAKKWSSVTPVILDRYPKKNKRGMCPEDIIAASCVRMGLPKPERVRVARHSNVPGSPPAFGAGGGSHGGWRPPKSGGLNGRYMCHASIAFSDPVPGPVLIGAGRYYGLGLFVKDRDR